MRIRGTLVPATPLQLVRMGLTYFKRFRMEIDLTRPLVVRPLPAGYSWLAWDESLVSAHAETKFRSFRTEIDANVFPCLGELDGCNRLMEEISHRFGFLPEATWLVVAQSRPGDLSYCGTIQGCRDESGLGSIQNLGVVPKHRARGLGTCLMHRALEGFRRVGLDRAFLEVTAQNSGAIRLYREMGFRKAKTLYKVTEVAYS